MHSGCCEALSGPSWVGVRHNFFLTIVTRKTKKETGDTRHSAQKGMQPLRAAPAVPICQAPKVKSNTLTAFLRNLQMTLVLAQVAITKRVKCKLMLVDC